MALTTAQGSAAYLNRAFNDANATPTAFAATVADLTANEMDAADKFDVPALTDAALAKQVLTNMGLLPTTNTSIAALEPALADYFATAGKGHRGFVVLQLARILADKTADATYGAAATAWNAEVAASIVDSAANTVALTTAADKAVGGQADDIFNGVLSTLSTASTLGATDVITGSTGNDTLNIDVSTIFSGFTTGSMSGVEKVVLNNKTTAAVSGFDATGTSGVTEYTINGGTAGQPVNLSDVQTGVKTYNLNNIIGDGVSAPAFSSVLDAAYAAEVAGTADAVTINANGVGQAALYMTTTLAKIEEVTLNSTGANFISLAGASDLKKLTVAGAGTTYVSAVPTTLTSFDASAATGAVTANLTATTATLTKVAMGSGSDSLTMSTADISGTGTMTGGAGTNSITLKNSGTTENVVEYTLTDFKKLTVENTNTASTGLTFSGAKTTGLTEIAVGTVNNGKTAFVNMGSGALTFTNTGAGNNVTTLSDHTGATTLTYVAGTSTTATQAPQQDFTFGSSTGALTVNVLGGNTLSGSVISAPKATSLTLTTTSKLDTAGTTELTAFNESITVEEATTVTVNSGGTLGSSAAVVAAKATSVYVDNKTNSGTLTLTGSKIALLDVKTSAALDLDETNTNLSGVETLIVAANSDQTTLPNLVKLSSATLSGAGLTAGSTTNSKVVLGNLGQTSNTYDLNLTATGLKGGLTAGNLAVGAGQDINVTLTGMTGPVSLAATTGTIGSVASGTETDDITITAAGLTTSTISLGTIAAKGDVTVNTSGSSTTTITTGGLTGDNVTLNMADTGTSTSGTINVNAISSATITASALVANTVTVTGNALSTALPVYVKAGVLTDSLTINGGDAQTSVVVTGDMGAQRNGESDNVIVSSKGTINISGLLNYETSTLTGTTGANTITGGAGNDIIRGGQGQDTLTGGAGYDSFRFNSLDSLVTAPDTITDFSATYDEIWVDALDGSATAATLATTNAATATTGTIATINSYGVAVLSGTTPATLSAAASAVDYAIGETTGKAALFTYGGSTYIYIDTDAASDLVIKLTGVNLPSTTPAETTSTTGLSGFGQ